MNTLVGLNDYLKSKKKKLITNSTNIEVEMLDSGLTLSKSALEVYKLITTSQSVVTIGIR